MSKKISHSLIDVEGGELFEAEKNRKDGKINVIIFMMMTDNN